MQSQWRSFQDNYLSFDRRVLGVFRAALGAVLLYDLLRRWPDASLLWSSDGVLSSATLRKSPQDFGQFSLLLGFSGAASVKLLFAGLGVVFVLYGVGLLTWLMQPLALLGYASLNARNLFFEDGGTGCVILLLTWTLLLPLGERFSVDALLRDARSPRLKDRVATRMRLKQPLITLAALAVLLQAAAIYWLNAAHKTGHTWRSGEAVHWVLWQHRVNTPLALWLSAHEPIWFSPLSTWLTRRTEFVLPVLLLWPSHPARTRSLAFVLAVLLHGGIALTMTLGPFSYAMICLLWLAVPGAAVSWTEARLPRRWFWRLGKLRTRAVRWLRRGLPRAPLLPRAEASAALARHAATAREVVLAWMLIVEGASVLGSNRAIPKMLRVAPRPWLHSYKTYLRANQAWSMFAPDAPTEDGTIVVDAVTLGGRHLDPFTGREPNWEEVRLGLAPHRIAVSDYFLCMKDARNARYRRDLARYMKAYPAATPNDRLRSADVWWVYYRPPARGSYKPGPLLREKLWHAKL